MGNSVCIFSHVLMFAKWIMVEKTKFLYVHMDMVIFFFDSTVCSFLPARLAPSFRSYAAVAMLHALCA